MEYEKINVMHKVGFTLSRNASFPPEEDQPVQKPDQPIIVSNEAAQRPEYGRHR